MKKSLALALAAGMCCALTGVAAAQVTYPSTTTPVAITDAVTVDNSITVSGGQLIGDLDVRINITHTWDSDLDIVLIPPGGTEYIHLTSDNQGTGDNYVDTVFDQDASASITTAVAPATGNWLPEGGVLAGWIGTIPLPPNALPNLDSVVGRSANGTWTLRIDDDAGGDVGTLNSWALIVTTLGSPTNPNGIAALNPNAAASGAVVLATVSVTPGAFPVSTGIQVIADASALDGGSNVVLRDNGVAPDAAAGDNIYSANITVGPAASLGLQNVSFVISDAQARSSTTNAAFTVNPPASPNDLCDSAEVIPVTSFPYASGPSFIFGNVRTPELGMSCSTGGAANVNSTVWYSITPTQSGNYRFSTSLGLATGNNVADTVIAIYSSADGTCGSLSEIGCDDDSGDGLQSDKTVALTAGSTYFVQVGKWALGAPVATNTLGIWVDLPNTSPAGTMTLTPNSGYEGATFDAFVRVTPGGNPTSTGLAVSVDASAVNGGSVTLHDDGIAPDAAAGDNIFSGTVSVGAGAIPGAQAISFGVADAEGRSGSGTANYTVIPIPTGACCTGISCDIRTQAECATAGGTYQGDNSPCTTGDGYSFADSSSAFEDISDTGALGPATDDSSVLAPIGFGFTFFGNTYSDVNVCSNGFINFGAASTVFTNTAIPTAAVPNDAIYAMWDDFNPATAGDVFYETRGTAGTDLRFIAQWNAVPQFGGTDSNTFQVVLFENGTIELRYANISAFTDADATVGVENSDGTLASSTPASSIVSNSAKRLTFTPGAPVCGPSCGWQSTGCFANYNNDPNGIDGDDVISFFADWDAGSSCADVDGANGTDGDDVITFFAAWDAGGIGTPGC